MTRWVRWAGVWHVLEFVTDYTDARNCAFGLCGHGGHIERCTFSDFEPVEDECRLCRRALDGGKT